jgi:hypothetical protein
VSDSVIPVVPIRPMGRLPAQPLTFPSVLTVGLQVTTKNSSSGAWDSSIINVP